MKKVVSLILAFVLCLSMCACEQNVTVSNVEALIEAIGEVSLESENQIVAAEEAYNTLSEEEKTSVENYDTLISARTALDKMLLEQSICGEWHMLQSSNVFIFKGNGEGTFSDGTEQLSFTYEINDTTIRLYVAGEVINLSAEEDSDGILHLKAPYRVDCVQKQYVANFAPESVEITIDNWSDYFEIRQYDELLTNAFGDYIGFNIMYGVFLKEEYFEIFNPNSNISFEIQTDYSYKTFTFDTETGVYTIGDPLDYDALVAEYGDYASYFGIESGTETEIITPAIQSDGTFFAVKYSANYDVENPVEIFDCIRVDENPQILRVTGTLYLNN